MLSRAERRERTPSLETLARACGGLGVTLSEFFAEPPPSPSPHVQTAAEPREDPAEAFVEALEAIQRGLAGLLDASGARSPRRRSRGPRLER